MFHPTIHLIDAVVEQLQQAYQRMYGPLEPAYATLICQAGHMALHHRQ